MLEAQKEKQLEERAKYIEKTKNLLVFKDTPSESKPIKKGKVRVPPSSLKTREPLY